MRIDGKLTASVPLATVCSARGRPLSEALAIHTHTHRVTKYKHSYYEKRADAYRLYFSKGSSFHLATDTQPSNLLKAVWNNSSFIYNFQWPLALRHAVNQI